MLHMLAKDDYVAVKREAEDRWRCSQKVMSRTCCIALLEIYIHCLKKSSHL